jgi:hypothetical protein
MCEEIACRCHQFWFEAVNLVNDFRQPLALIQPSMDIADLDQAVARELRF